MNNKQRHEIIDYLEQGEKFTDLLIRELDREDISSCEKRTYSSLLDAIRGATELYSSMTEWPDNVEVFVPKDRKPIKDNTTILIKHGPMTIEKALELSDLIKNLPLNHSQNGSLISSMKEQLLIAEHEQYIAGFVECMNTVREGGFKGLEDKLEVMVSHEE